MTTRFLNGALNDPLPERCEENGDKQRQLAKESAKACRKCGETKPLEGFPPNARLRDGRSSWCRDCHAEACRRWRDANPDRVEAYNESRRAEPRWLTDAEREERNRRLREQARQARERQEELRRRYATSRPCQECSRPFLPKNVQQRFCSSNCRYRARDRRRKR